MKKFAALVAGAGPVLIALAALPGTAGKVAAAAVAALAAFGFLHVDPPKA
jgi:hypothetical protein